MLKMSDVKFSVLVYNLNDYEKFHELPDAALSPNIEYVYVTDNPKIKSNRWKLGGFETNL